MIGAWTLVTYYIEDENGHKEYPLGEKVTGMLLYTPDGYMSAQLMAANRRHFQTNNIHKGTKEEYAEAGQ